MKLVKSTICTYVYAKDKSNLVQNGKSVSWIREIPYGDFSPSPHQANKDQEVK
jgi:hypothetical protein